MEVATSQVLAIASMAARTSSRRWRSRRVTGLRPRLPHRRRCRASSRRRGRGRPVHRARLRARPGSAPGSKGRSPTARRPRCRYRSRASRARWRRCQKHGGWPDGSDRGRPGLRCGARRASEGTGPAPGVGAGRNADLKSEPRCLDEARERRQRRLAGTGLVGAHHALGDPGALRQLGLGQPCLFACSPQDLASGLHGADYSGSSMRSRFGVTQSWSGPSCQYSRALVPLPVGHTCRASDCERRAWWLGSRALKGRRRQPTHLPRFHEIPIPGLRRRSTPDPC